MKEPKVNLKTFWHVFSKLLVKLIPKVCEMTDVKITCEIIAACNILNRTLTTSREKKLRY